MPIRITGLNSGLDTEAIISALVSSYNYKTDKYKKAQTKLSWKQDAWKALNTKIYSLYNSVGNLRLSTAYNLKTTKVSDPAKASVSAGSNAPTGTQKLNILQMAQAGYLTGGKLDDSTMSRTTLAELGYTGGDGQIDVTKGDGTTASITVTQGTTVGEFIASLKDAGLSANYDETNKRIFISSKETGKDNDFTLTGSNVDGLNALNKLGLNVQSAATDATYETYTKYYDSDGNVLSQNVVDALKAYQDAKKEYDAKSAQNANMTGAYGYARAYSAMKEALEKSGLSAAEQDKLQTLLGMSASERVNSVMDKDGNVYKQKGTDKDGNQIFSYEDGNGNEKLIQKKVTYTDGANDYTLNPNNTLSYDGKIYTATDEKDGDKTVYKDEDGNKVSIEEKTEYYEVTAEEKPTGYMKYTDGDGVTYAQNDDATYTASDGKLYRLNADTKEFIEIDKEGNDVAKGRKAVYTSEEPITETIYNQVGTSPLSDITRSADVLTELKENPNYALTEEEEATLVSDVAVVKNYETTADTVLDAADPYSRESIVNSIKNAYAAGGAADVTNVVNGYAALITQNKEAIKTAESTMEEHKVLAGIAAIDTSTVEGQEEYDKALADFVQKVQDSKQIVDNIGNLYNSDARKVDGRDSKIMLNGIEYESSRNTYSINGLSITLQGETGPDEADALTITTTTDTQGIYDKVKDFLTQYNALINEITSLFNAPPVKGYEPLTGEEKDAMSDSDVEKWEAKIKDSLLRRDDSLGGVMNAMTSAMSKGFNINGKMYYLSSFGIKTQGYLDAPSNQNNAYHIDGDADDAVSSGNVDKLMAAITSDPDTVVSFMQQLATGLYDAIGDKMKSTALSSAYTVYNDKEMASEYSDYTSLIKKWEEKLAAQEDYYYKKFAAMETALSKINSQSSSLGNLFGGGM